MQSVVRFDDVQVGDHLPVLEGKAVNRTMLALFAGASGDHNPVHIDIDFARAAGMPDVFAHGMLGMAWLGRLVTNWVSPMQLRSLEARFTGITHLGNRITCVGEVTEKLEQGPERRVRLKLSAVNQYGETKILGEALVALD